MAASRDMKKAAGEEMFGELWIDREADVAARMAQVPDDIRPYLQDFIETGYVIFSGAVPVETVDEIIADKNRIYAEPEKFVLKKTGSYIDPVTLEKLDRAHRVVDLFAISRAARDAISAPQVSQFLQVIFEDDPIAMQSIYFEYGSQQALHQDTAYVISEKPLSLAACWIALEDIKAGSGELVYYPRSHRFEPYLFSGEFKNWTPKRDGQEQHQAFLQGLHTQAKERGIERESFLARKGDILIWHADLAHGGAPIDLPDQTRMSLVAHFCPRSVKATYRQHIPDTYREVEHANGMYFTCRHYDLAPLEQGRDEATLIYDGGISKRRNDTDEAKAPPPGLTTRVLRRLGLR